MSNTSFARLGTDFINTTMSFFEEDTFTSLPSDQKDFIFQYLLEQVAEKRQKERDHHALQVLVDMYCLKQGYEVGYGPRSKWIAENKKRLAEEIQGMEEDEVEPFFERYKPVDCGECEDCVQARARECEGDGGQDSNVAEMPS
ncbi:uncharacterized protein LACBIDRAFT_301932 [Laccaria bicolor S238N-H82]|uniref:Predicted protein n=1 Tax=Laccaria bicolor (strain S238N-H82 / ATCC MYA-4686) TaxID=486041 RepID=B0CPY4_LACBS|nr:uncharacterized protein LACBIDRAFT_301932 [Laccaria bicolor S238N-H82]EDR15494.1 predicted protein [Laccaria bicolor S238N-H82]|eukprot:XP_001873702.1 predicted protein [Laccaria bicolor S238N-H82]